MKVKGNADKVISRGEIIIRDEKFVSNAGKGNFIKRNISSTELNHD